MEQNGWMKTHIKKRAHFSFKNINILPGGRKHANAISILLNNVMKNVITLSAHGVRKTFCTCHLFTGGKHNDKP